MNGKYHRHRHVPWPVKVAAAAVFIPGFVLLGTWIGMSLWNALMPQIFGLGTLSFWQTMGLLLLAKLFFGCGHGRGHSPFPRKPRFRDREDWKAHLRDRFADNRGRGHEHPDDSEEPVTGPADRTDGNRPERA